MLNRLKKAFWALALLTAATACRASAVEALPAFKTGQIIAISEMLVDPSTFLFEAATGSRYGHIGIIAQAPEGPVVYHANPPGTQNGPAVQRIPLDDFLARARINGSAAPQATVLEPVRPLSREEQQALVAEMDRMMAQKVPYNYSQAVNPDSVNCSEFCHNVFDAIGRSGIGDIQRLDQSNLQAFGGALARLWGKLPPGDSPAVSPFSVVSSPQLKVVHAGLPVDKRLSDAEIFQAWKDGGGLEGFSRMTGIPMRNLEAMGARASRTPYRPYPASWRQP